MKWDQIEGNWKHVAGVAKDKAERQLAAWQRAASDKWFTTTDTKPK
jgi:uncharacterized protein YjbJ (UPF0337 family)